MTKIAIIGTAGRDKSMPMTPALWQWMLRDISERTSPDDHLVSGGAAWADHLAVALFITRKVDALTLYLPAPLGPNGDGRFVGPYKSAASAANYYHDRFSEIIQSDTLAELALAANMDNCDGGYEPIAEGYGAMFNRNRKVAADCEQLIAYTFGTGGVPADGGTKDTWDKCRGERIHVPLPRNADHLFNLATDAAMNKLVAQELALESSDIVRWARRGGYECSTKGDVCYSAFRAMMPDGRTIEQHYQCDIKGYAPGGTNWRLGKGKPPLDTTKDLWEEYLGLWRTWAKTNPEQLDHLASMAKRFNNTLSDCFASTDINQARALATLLNERTPT